MARRNGFGDPVLMKRLLIRLILAPAVLVWGAIAQAQDLGTVLFDFDSASLDAEAATQVRAIAEALEATPSYKPTIVVGYTDAVGSTGYNLALGQRRAQTVADALTAQGVPVSRIGTIASRGEADLVVAVATAERRNRRVNVALDDMLSACRSYRDIDLNPAGFGDAFQVDLQSRLAEAVNAYSRFTGDSQNGPAFQMAGAAKYDCGIAAGLGPNEDRKLEYGPKCFCNSARLRVALGGAR